MHMYMSAEVTWIQLGLVFQSFPTFVSSIPNGSIHNPVDCGGGGGGGEHMGKWETSGKRWKIKMSESNAAYRLHLFFGVGKVPGRSRVS